MFGIYAGAIYAVSQGMLRFLRTHRGRGPRHAQHEHLSDLSAAALGQSLLQTEEGIREIKRFMREDIRSAKFRGHPDTAQELKQVLAQFKDTRSGAINKGSIT